MTDLKQKTERFLALAVDPLDGTWLIQHMADHLRALQAENDRLREECEALRVDAEIGAMVRAKLRSGNRIPVERCQVLAKEVAEIAAMDRERGG